MSKLPPRLLYLVIYNPTLSPPASSLPDDEDAEEQAHVLFYTADNHAVSRDRVLRQVGLAKALANFTTIFGPQVSCDSVHSQNRKMVMLSPEPDFWIHACFELEKTPRASRKDEKGKGKQKEPAYDHNEASLHDAALQTQFLMGYEAFKVTHGPFTSILKSLGREALELQLERFFTVWAWSWDLSKPVSFPDYLGVRVHSLSNQLMPLVDILEDKLPPHYFPLVLISSCIVTSKSTPVRCSPALIRHLSRILESSTPSQQAIATGKDPNSDPSSQDLAVSPLPVNDQAHARAPSRTFLGVPGFNMNVNMDVRKWNWPGYLTFGIGGPPSGQKTSQYSSSADSMDEKSRRQTAYSSQDKDLDKSETAQVHSETSVDAQALEDALSSRTGSQNVATPEESGLVVDDTSPEGRKFSTSSGQGPHVSHPVSPAIDTSLSVPARDDCSLEVVVIERDSMSDMEQASSQCFSEIYVHLPDSNPLDTRRRLVRYLCRDNIIFALVPSSEGGDDYLDAVTCQYLADRGIELMGHLKEIVQVEQEKIASAFSSSPVQNVLQKSQHVITLSNQLIYTSSSFSATSWHLHDGRRSLGLDPDLLEIYSRGQSPQDWHLAKRGLGVGMRGEVYMEIGRKEASLVDVDSEITGVLRRSAE